MSATGIAAEMIQAYLETEYRVSARPAFTLRVGQASAELLQTQQVHKVTCSAFISACNPFSQPLDQTDNSARQAALAKELANRSLSFLPGIGQHPSNNWPGEDSFLVFGLTLEAAKALASQFEQNALIWSAADAVPQLVLLR